MIDRTYAENCKDKSLSEYGEKAVLRHSLAALLDSAVYLTMLSAAQVSTLQKGRIGKQQTGIYVGETGLGLTDVLFSQPPTEPRPQLRQCTGQDSNLHLPIRSPTSLPTCSIQYH